MIEIAFVAFCVFAICEEDNVFVVLDMLIALSGTKGVDDIVNHIAVVGAASKMTIGIIGSDLKEIIAR